jgi:hypothetical protein
MHLSLANIGKLFVPLAKGGFAVRCMRTDEMDDCIEDDEFACVQVNCVPVLAI